jgi:hypothetical protein
MSSKTGVDGIKTFTNGGRGLLAGGMSGYLKSYVLVICREGGKAKTRDD